VQLITRRLQTIQQEAEAKPPMALDLLKALGQAYQQVRSPELAINVYEQILAIAHQQDRVTEEATLKTLAELHISWFDYPKAALRYEELLVFAKAEGDRYNQVTYLQQLAYIYDKLIQPERALTAKQQLAELYIKKPDLALLLPALKIAIAADYEALKLADDASQNYQEAYRLALASQQFAYASEALQKLAALYESFDQFDYALQVYQVLLQVDQQSYDFYGMMNVYDKIGQIYLKQKNYPQALTAFKQGLELAKSLKYQENYFTTQIEQATQQNSQ
jgi:tetratricopeptide (TPR) repeat protein